MSVDTAEIESIKAIISPWDSLEIKIQKFIEKFWKILQVTQEKIQEILMISKPWEISPKTLERVEFFFELFQILESACHSFQTKIEDILKRPVESWQRWPKIILKQDDPELAQYTNLREIILSGNREHIQAATYIYSHLYYWDLS